MIMILSEEWDLLDGTKPKEKTGKEVKVPAGRHEVEIVPNPYGLAAPWIVLKGTLTGSAEGSLRDWPGIIDFEE